MSADREIRTDDPNRFLYWVIATGAIVLAVIGLITYSGNKETREAQDKAAELTQKLEQVGLQAPENDDVFVRSFGTDGGAVCDNPASALGKATLYSQLTNGASFVGSRPIIADGRVVVGELLIIDTYCPEKVEQFKDKIADKIKVDDTIKD